MSSRATFGKGTSSTRAAKSLPNPTALQRLRFLCGRSVDLADITKNAAARA
jgi:hypothetical protein